jgi:putative DNA primase/helicase
MSSVEFHNAPGRVTFRKICRLLQVCLSNVTPATVFRVIERWHPTLLIDETDTFLSDKSELRGVFNSGHTKSQAYVLRCVGDELVPSQFSTWAPKAFAAIGRMHPTLEDRSISIELKRKLPTEKVKRIPKNEDAFLDLLRQCARWANDQFEALMRATPTSPALNDRARDNWEPLLGIAEACGDEGQRKREWQPSSCQASMTTKPMASNC